MFLDCTFCLQYGEEMGVGYLNFEIWFLSLFFIFSATEESSFFFFWVRSFHFDEFPSLNCYNFETIMSLNLYYCYAYANFSLSYCAIAWLDLLIIYIDRKGDASLIDSTYCVMLIYRLQCYIGF